MRWKTNKPEPKEGDIRYRNKFAFFPTVVNDYRVWLESYQVTEEFKKIAALDTSYIDWKLEWVEVSRRTCDYYV